MNTRRVCVRCGAVVEADDRVCRSCGTVVRAVRSTAESDFDREKTVDRSVLRRLAADSAAVEVERGSVAPQVVPRSPT